MCPSDHQVKLGTYIALYLYPVRQPARQKVRVCQMTLLEPFLISLIQQSIHRPLQIVVVPLYYCTRQFVFQLVSVVKQFVVTKRANVHGNGNLNLWRSGHFKVCHKCCCF